MTRGVEARESSIRLSFAFEGKTERKTLMVEGKPMAPTPANMKYAARLIVEIKQRIKAGAFSMAEYFPVNGTVGRGGAVSDQLDHWLGLQDIEASTKAGYQSAIKFWKNAPLGDGSKFGARLLTAVRHSDILMAYKSKPKMHGKTRNNYTAVLRASLELAVMDKVLRENPCANIEAATWQKEDPDPFDLEEVEKIVAYMRQNYHASIANMVETRFFTGVRTSEMVGLQWPSIDFNKSHMVVREAIVRGDERKGTKTNMIRIVNLNSRAMSALKAQKEHTFLPGGPVFTDPRYGTPWLEERAFRRSFWTPTLKALGIRYRPPNTARHTYATMLLMAGARPAYAAKQMGHSIEMFLNTYSKWIDGGENDVEVSKLENFIKTPVAAPKAANEH